MGVEHDELIRDAQDVRNEQVWAIWEEKAREYLLAECFEHRIDTLLDIFKDDMAYWMGRQWLPLKTACSKLDFMDMGHDLYIGLENTAKHWISTEDGQRRLNEIVWELEREAKSDAD